MADSGSCQTPLSPEVLMRIVEMQNRLVDIGPDLGNVMAAVAQEAQELTHSDGAAIELFEGEEMVYRAVSGTLTPFLGLRLPGGESLSGLCVRKGKALYSSDTSNDARVNHAAVQKVGAESMLVFPLQFGKQNIGVLKVISKTRKFYSDTTLDILSLISKTMAAAMYHAGQYAKDDLLMRATTDAMTGVNNRAAFYEKLRLQLQIASMKTPGLGVMVIDMDGLKAINDQYGHRAGDEAIRELARRLAASVRANDLVARLGGDEFGVILGLTTDTTEITAIMDRFRETLAKPYMFEEHSLVLSASIGWARYPEDASELTELIDTADKRMYDDKHARKVSR